MKDDVKQRPKRQNADLVECGQKNDALIFVQDLLRFFIPREEMNLVCTYVIREFVFQEHLLDTKPTNRINLKRYSRLLADDGNLYPLDYFIELMFCFARQRWT